MNHVYIYTNGLVVDLFKINKKKKIYINTGFILTLPINILEKLILNSFPFETFHVVPNKQS